MTEYTVKINKDGDKSWWLNGKIHREDGPALEFADGSKIWWLNGKIHREDGPAVEYSDGTKKWWLHGSCYSEEEFNDIITIDGVQYKRIDS